MKMAAMKRGFIFPGVHGEPINVEPGIYQADKVSFDEYLRWNAISNSSLSAAIRKASPLVLSMAHYHQQKPADETPAMRFGTYAHAAKFEFLRCIEEYDVMPDFTVYREKRSPEADPEMEKLPDGTLIEAPCLNDDGKTVSKVPRATKDYKGRVSRYQSRPDKIGKRFVTNEELERLAGVLRALDRDQRAMEYFANNGLGTDRELCIVWDDPVTGLRCKGRLDCVQHAARLIVDLKTSKNVARFEDAIAWYGYHRQGAFYSDGMQVLTGEAYRPAIAAVEPDQPHGVRAAPLSFASLTTGRSQYRQIVDAIAKSVESNKWPAMQSPAEWDIPAWSIPNTLEVIDGTITQF